MYKDQISVLSIYSFVKIADPAILQPQILHRCHKKMIKGTIIVAEEGFNGTITGSPEATKYVLDELMKLTGSDNVNIKENFAPAHQFSKMKVKIKKEIVALGVDELNLDMRGEYIETQDWDKYLKRDDVVLIDTRNDYEVEMGTFKNAVNPYTRTFKEFPKWVADNKEKLENKKILMCCTGGIRCEKSTAYMKQAGFDEVYHLKGGILQYLEDTKNKNDMWQGECFVFDDRVAVDSNLAPSEINTVKPEIDYSK